MLAFVIYVVAVLAVVAIGLVTVGRETFAASLVARPAVYELDEAVAFVAARLDERTAGRLTPDDVEWILTVDAAQFADADARADEPGVDVLDDEVAVRRVLDRLEGDRRDLIDALDVTAVIAARTTYLVAIGAIGPRAPGPTADTDTGPEPGTSSPA